MTARRASTPLALVSIAVLVASCVSAPTGTPADPGAALNLTEATTRAT